VRCVCALCTYFSFVLFFRNDCGVFVLKNADCLGQDLDPAEDQYAQKDMPDVRRRMVLELIRQTIISGTAAATLPPSIDPKLCDKGSGESKGDGDQTKGGIKPYTLTLTPSLTLTVTVTLTLALIGTDAGDDDRKLCQVMGLNCYGESSSWCVKCKKWMCGPCSEWAHQDMKTTTKQRHQMFDHAPHDDTAKTPPSINKGSVYVWYLT
jgi:hypothetical protein